MVLAENNEVDIGNSDFNNKNKTVKRSSFKNLNGTVEYLTPKARWSFTQLRKIFIKALIFQHFDQKCYIWIETDISGYSIGRVLNQL